MLVRAIRSLLPGTRSQSQSASMSITSSIRASGRPQKAVICMKASLGLSVFHYLHLLKAHEMLANRLLQVSCSGTTVVRNWFSRYLGAASGWLALSSCLLFVCVSASRTETTLIDIAGRQVTIAAPARRIILVESWYYPALAILDKEVAGRIIGIGGNPRRRLAGDGARSLRQAASRQRMGANLLDRESAGT